MSHRVKGRVISHPWILVNGF